MFVVTKQTAMNDNHFSLGIVQYIELGIFLFLFIWLLSILVRPKTAMKHWHHFLGYRFSSDDLYQKIISEIEMRKIPDIDWRYHQYFEAGIASARREFLCIQFKKYSLDVCCFPYGTGTYISWWLGEEDPGILSRIPIINSLLGKNPLYQSYYQIDTATFFQSAVHDAILAVIDKLSNAKGLRQLSDIERQPVPWR